MSDGDDDHDDDHADDNDNDGLAVTSNRYNNCSATIAMIKLHCNNCNEIIALQ